MKRMMKGNVAILCVALVMSGCSLMGGRDRVAANPVDAVVRVDVPTKSRTVGNYRETHYNSGAGAILADGRIVTALHVFVDEDQTRPGHLTLVREQSMWDLKIRAWNVGLRDSSSPLAHGARVKKNAGIDLAVFKPKERITEPGARVATRRPAPGDKVTAYLLARRGGRYDFSLTTLTTTVLGRSENSPHFAIAGSSIPGDSGGPVFNADGQLIGVVIGGGPGCAPFRLDVDLTRPQPFHARWYRENGSRCADESILAVDLVKALH